MNNNEINHLDPDDIGLKAIMGNRFHDETKKPMVEPFSTNTTKAEKVAKKPTNKAVDAQWEPARPEPNQMDKLKSCAKSVLLFGGLSFLIFYWQQTGLMAASVAVPSMCVCTALAGWGVGKNARGEPLMAWTDDPVADFERHDRKQAAWLNSLPECSICGDPIQQEKAFHKDGFWICDECYEGNQKEVIPDE